MMSDRCDYHVEWTRLVWGNMFHLHEWEWDWIEFPFDEFGISSIEYYYCEFCGAEDYNDDPKLLRWNPFKISLL